MFFLMQVYTPQISFDRTGETFLLSCQEYISVSTLKHKTFTNFFFSVHHHFNVERIVEKKMKNKECSLKFYGIDITIMAKTVI